MARSLLLLRHAKSSRDDPELADFDRPLAPRGERAAPLIASTMAARGWRPDVALVSPAARARRTFELAAAQAGWQPELHMLDALYMAEPEALLAEIRKAPAHAATVLLVGHNPGLEELAVALAGDGSDRAALGLLQQKFPTAALARLEVDRHWRDLDERQARLTDFLRPRHLAS